MTAIAPERSARPPMANRPEAHPRSSWLRAHPLLAFFAVAYAITWPPWLLGAAGSHGLIGDVPLVFILGGLGPGLAAVLVMRAMHGKAGDRHLTQALLRWRVPAVWVALAIAIPVGIRLATAGMTGGFAGVWIWGSAGAVLASLARYLVQAVPEEIGWRGFALPRLQRRFTALTSSLLLGAVWGLWHVPLLLTAGEVMSTYPKIAFFSDLMASAVLYTWLFNNTSGSLPVAIVFHALTNVLGPFVAAEAAVTAALAVVVVVVFGPEHLSRRHLRVVDPAPAFPGASHASAQRTLVVVVAAIALVLAGPGVPVASAAQRTVDAAAIDAFLNEQMRTQGIPGVAVAVFEGGQVTYTKGYGDAGGGRAVTPNVPMSLGSTSKTLTAVAVLQLVEQNAVDLDAPVVTYLPEFRIADDQAGTGITVRHLLNHTSGLSATAYNRVLDGHASLADGVRDLRHVELVAPVGTTFNYFNGNYSILALIVETVAQRPFADYVREHIYVPLGMDRSSAEGNDAPADLAQGHSKLFGFAVSRDAPPYPSMLGAGHLISTAPDLGRLGIALANDGAYGDTRILTRASVALMRTPPTADGNYGMGLVVGEHRGQRVESHDGAGPTFMGQLVMLPDLDRGYALVMNQEHLIDSIVVLPQLRTGLLDILLGQPAPAIGTSVRLIGGVLLLVLLVVTALAVRSARRLRGWPQRARAMTGGQLVRTIAPHLLVPLVVIYAIYQVSPALVGNPFNVRWVGRWYAPDILLLIGMSTLPDLLQGLYMAGAAVVSRRARPEPGATDQQEHRHLVGAGSSR